MSPRVVLGIVVEGTSDLIFLKQNAPWWRQKGFVLKVRQAQGRPRLIRDAQKHLDLLRQQGCHYVLFLLDQDQDPCAPATARRLANLRREPDVLVCVCVRELEAWFLADGQALQVATGTTFSHLPTDSLRDAKAQLKRLFQRRIGKFPTEVEMARRIAPHFSLERAAQGNRSAARCLHKLLALLHERM